MDNKCRFCEIIGGIEKYGVIDKPLFENEKFFVISSIGALVKGWLLVVPKEHKYNMSDYFENEEFCEFVHSVLVELKNKLGKDKNILIFEHGANHCGSLTGCGTDHAHLHVVPYDKTLYKNICEKRDWKICSKNYIKDYVNEKEYLLYADINNELNISEVYISLVDNPESQFFRKIIAEDMGNYQMFDYKEHPQNELSRATFEMFRGK